MAASMPNCYCAKSSRHQHHWGMMGGGGGGEIGRRGPGDKISYMMGIHVLINHGGRHCPMAAMRPHSLHQSTPQSANMLGNKFVPLKQGNIIVVSLAGNGCHYHHFFFCLLSLIACWTRKNLSLPSFVLEFFEACSIIDVSRGSKSCLFCTSYIFANLCIVSYGRFWHAKFFCIEFIVLFLGKNHIPTYQKVQFFFLPKHSYQLSC